MGTRGAGGVEGTQGGGVGQEKAVSGEGSWVLSLVLVFLAISSSQSVRVWRRTGDRHPFSRVPSMPTNSNPHQTPSCLDLDQHTLS